MKSEPGIVKDDKRTRSWHGTPERRSPSGKTRSSGKSGFPAVARYWGRVNESGEFEQASSFPEPDALPFRFPWRAVAATVRGLLPSAIAAFIGAFTALSWQAIFVKARPAVLPAVVQPAHQSAPVAVPPAPVALPAVVAPAPVVAPEPAPAPVAEVQKVEPPRSAPPRSRPIVRRAPAAAKRPMPLRPTSRAVVVDEDGILEPTF